MSETTEAAAPTGAVDADVVAQTADNEQLTLPQSPVQDDDGAEVIAEAEPEDDGADYEINLGGNKEMARVPKALAERLNAYTASLQTEFQRQQEEAAASRKSLTERSTQIDAITNLDAKGGALLGQSQELQREYDRLRGVDMDALWQSNPDDARQISDRISRVQAAFMDATTQLGQHQAQRNASLADYTAQEIARIEQAGRAQVIKNIPAFDAKAEADLVAFAVSDGVSAEDAKAWARNPIATKWAYEAMQFRRMHERAAKAAAPTPPPATPSAPIRPKAAPSAKNPETMSMEEYVRWRSK